MNSSSHWIGFKTYIHYIPYFFLALWAFKLQIDKTAVIWYQMSASSTEQTTHQIFGKRSDSPRNSLLFSDSRYRSNTLFSSWSTQNIRCSGRCSSLGSLAPCSLLQPVGQILRRKMPKIPKRQSQDALSSIHTLPWRKSFWDHLLHTRCCCYVLLLPF